MAAPFQASKLFENTGNKGDGWDDWDWVDSNASNSAKAQFQQQQLAATIPPPQQFGQSPHGSSTVDNSTHMFNQMNSMPPPPIQLNTQIDQYGQQQQQQPMQTYQHTSTIDYDNHNSGPYSMNAINNNHVNNEQQQQRHYQQQPQQTYTTNDFVAGNQHQNSVNNNNLVNNNSSNYGPMGNFKNQPPAPISDANTINAFGHQLQQQQIPTQTQSYQQQSQQVEPQEKQHQHAMPPPSLPAASPFFVPAEQNAALVTGTSENGYPIASQTPNAPIDSQLMSTSADSTVSRYFPFKNYFLLL